MNLRKLAQGRECQIRLTGVCCHDPATTVLAHLNMSGISGRGYKSPDLLGSWCCFECHRCIDSNGQTHGLERDYVRAAFMDGMCRTIAILISEGIVKT